MYQTLKTTFNISIRHHKSYKYLSNMKTYIREKVEDVNDMLWTRFKSSPFMSAQHLRFAVTTFNVTNRSHSFFQVWCRRKIVEQVAFAESVAEGIFYYLNSKTTLYNYSSIPKLHYIIINNSNFSSIKIEKEFVLLR